MIIKKNTIGICCILTSILLNGCQKNDTDAVSNLQNMEATPTIQATVTPQPTKLPQVSVTPQPTELPQVSITPQPTKQPKATKEVTPTETDGVTKQKDEIIRQKPEYQNYTIYSYPLDNAFILFYENPDADKEDGINYYGDIWAVGENWVQQIQEDAYVLPDELGIGSINGKSYFRYDFSYVTGSSTNLVMLDDNEKLHQISLLGALSNISGNDITVIRSAYDMIYDKSEHYCSGHTWKPYYVYLEDYNIVEYPTKEISEEEFLEFIGASDLLKNLTSQYSEQGKTLQLKFMERENGLIHVNIYLESDDYIDYYYETYRIKEDRSLEAGDHGEGTYGSLPSDDIDMNADMNSDTDNSE